MMGRGSVSRLRAPALRHRQGLDTCLPLQLAAVPSSWYPFGVTPRLLVLLALGGAACNAPSCPDTTASTPSPAAPSSMTISPLMPECAPRGDVLTRTGKIESSKPDPERHRKEFLGARLVEPDGTRWVLTYAREGPLADLDGHRVEVRGRRCDPLYQAIVADHLLIDRLTVLP